MVLFDYLGLLVIGAGIGALFAICIVLEEESQTEKENKILHQTIKKLDCMILELKKENNKICEDLEIMIKDYEGLVTLNEKALNLACERLSKEVYIDYLNRYRTADEWKTEAYKQVGRKMSK